MIMAVVTVVVPVWFHLEGCGVDVRRDGRVIVQGAKPWR
jgi:hypothetical protein